MKPFIAVLSLLGTASAVDVAMYQSSNCKGGFLVCRGLSPHVCCASGIIFASAIPSNVPQGSVVRAYKGICAGISPGPDLRPSICNDVTGYNFTSVMAITAGISKKRAAGPAATPAECVRPDTLVLGDGTAYDLTGLSDGDFENLTEAALGADRSADVPSKLEALQI
ncbi:hypothetical protein GGTG_12237 [Gaeumannomyces tritici R3-111a-1]|uniref:Hydrophobin n=1 Tax=Gaeumannomyces tritici (strain R3-111a-1) TaxID=644352 RepID=J3PFG2_GAET3|nr:hypothetical protein GGTG_12237 [Gaeumannomyces tritici R3-111a-1]EJT70064.1 hypothetical protein GGTG_12237 [Gaeumannomyces tritici R3-111a-1]